MSVVAEPIRQAADVPVSFRYPPPPAGYVDLYGPGASEISDSERESAWRAISGRVPVGTRFIAIRIADGTYSTGESESEALEGFLSGAGPKAFQLLLGQVYVRRYDTPFVSRMAAGRAARYFGNHSSANGSGQAGRGGAVV